MSLDIQLFYALHSLAGKSPMFDSVIIFFATYLAYILVAVFIAFLLLSRYELRQKLEILVVVSLSSIIARLGITEIIRFFYHRPRPFIDLPIHPLFTDSAWSFPSGHSAFFFAIATALFLYNKKWGTGFFIATILVTLGRVAAGVHYPLDIIGGALIGIAVAYVTFFIARKYAQLNPLT